MLNGILIVDKPEGMTSQGVVSRLRRILNERRIGHGGTLDPLATGVLPVFVGRATRASDLILSADKSYVAHFRLGIATDTQDITGKILSVSDMLPSDGELRDKLRDFTGKIKQLPPMYSAIKIGGKKLYEIARSGGEVEREPRDIEIFSIDLLPSSSGETREYTIAVTCSKGTYIRTLIHDIGVSLGCGAVLTALRRTRTGSFDISEAKTPDEISSVFSAGGISQLLIPVDKLFEVYPKTNINAEGERLCRYGAPVPTDAEHSETPYRVYGPDGGFLMLGKTAQINGKTFLKTVKNFFDVG